ncbi:MAG: HIT family protein [Candidatus Aureabacteria bacterium]|nr:HIT family protein [Candidatus Auribacterota bacterium]
MSDCVFCKIIKGEIPSSKVFEDENVYAFLDINPASKGHLLIVPKKHSESLDELGEQEFSSLFAAIRKIARALLESLDNTGFNLLMNSGKDAGQIIPHVHFHIIPRKKKDGLSISSWPFLKFSGDHLQEIAKSISEHIRD